MKSETRTLIFQVYVRWRQVVDCLESHQKGLCPILKEIRRHFILCSFFSHTHVIYIIPRADCVSCFAVCELRGWIFKYFFEEKHHSLFMNEETEVLKS